MKRQTQGDFRRPRAILRGVALVGLLTLLTSSCGLGIFGTRVDFSGTVYGAGDEPVRGATVEIDGASIETDSAGEFLLETRVDRGVERLVYSILADDYFEFVGGAPITENGGATVEVVLMQREYLGTVDSSTGGTLSTTGMSVDFPADAFVDEDGNPYDGQVDVFASMTSPNDADFASTMPGGDFSALTGNSEPGSLVSFGAFNMEMDGASDQALQLARDANVDVPLPSSMANEPTDDVQFWELDDEGVWRELGDTTFNGSSFEAMLPLERPEGTTRRTRTMNVDAFNRTALVTGTVYNFGEPVPTTRVDIGQTRVFTDADGEYAARVPANRNLLFDTDYGQVTSEVPSEGAVVDIGIEEEPGFGEGSFVFDGESRSGNVAAVGSEWVMTDFQSVTWTLNFYNVPSSGSESLDSSYLTSGATFEPYILYTDFNGDVWASYDGTITRDGRNLSFEASMESLGTGAQTTLSGLARGGLLSFF